MEFLDSLDWSIALLQEVSPEAVEAIRSGIPGVSVVSGVELLRDQTRPATRSRKHLQQR